MYYATAKEMARLDDLAIKNGLEIRQMMELAGWHMLVLFRHLKISQKSRITIVCGKGNQAGDGLCAARHLFNYGYRVNIILLSKTLTPDAAHHLRLIKKMYLPIVCYLNNKTKAKKIINNSDILIDALIGYNLSGAPRGDFKEIVELMNQTKKKIIAYDIPTGLDSTTGECFLPCIKTWITLSLGLSKKAFTKKYAQKYCGKIYIADIGIPKFIYNKIAANCRPPFEKYKDGLVPLT